MRHAPALLLLLLPALGADDPKPDADKIQGTWEVAGMTAGGREMPAEMTKEIRFQFTKDKMEVSGGVGKGEKRELSFKLITDTTPKGLDSTALNGPFKGKTNRGIYQIDGDELKICLPNKDSDERPEKFESKEGTNLVLFVLKRVKD